MGRRMFTTGDAAAGIGLALAIAAFVYVGVAWSVFQWRNPTANEASFYRDFSEVVTFQKMPQYQVDE